ncbi:DUF3455 domain-containing protein [Cupriavidus respiraculi]|uniref:DUF3455 domain-containing protein n=1 Tax=Cupriavidus respiraculi TaxID=195930 RepID=UPI001C96628A|nr:DUF3455 domain-containing protein [Cupriavidus respiraculi]MBY4948055.1 DUF3455 domain-containing protein [Cupriavidus respiraculi]
MSRTSLLCLATCSALAACAGGTHHAAAPMSPVADAVKVPDGHRVAMQTVGVGEILYECRPRKDMADQFEWAFVGPDAVLSDRAGKPVGRYYGPPATWEASDGSKVTATQVAVSPAGAGNIPLQLVKANPAQGNGAMTGVTYIQRLATRGGVAPAAACAAANKGAKQTVRYQADYIFWKAA